MLGTGDIFETMRDLIQKGCREVWVVLGDVLGEAWIAELAWREQILISCVIRFMIDLISKRAWNSVDNNLRSLELEYLEIFLKTDFNSTLNQFQ